MRSLDLARDAVRTDGDFSAGIPAIGRMPAELANHAFYTWDSGRKASQIRASLSRVQGVTPSGTGLPAQSSLRFTGLMTDRSDLIAYASYTNSNALTPNDLMVVSLPSGTISTLVPASSSIAFYVLGSVGDGRVFRPADPSDPVLRPSIAVDLDTGSMTTYSTVRTFIDPRIGGKKYAYIKNDGTWVATDTIGSAETQIFPNYSITGAGSYNAAINVWLEELGLFGLLVDPFDYDNNALVWSRRGAHAVEPVPGSAAGASNVHALDNRLITNNGLLCEDHRKGSQVQITTFNVIGTHNGIPYVIDFANGSVGFSVSLTPDSFEMVPIAEAGDLDNVRIVHDRIWFKLASSDVWFFTGVLP